ncbi:calcineurin-like phosphoesterase C-terminal domain-containing protein [Fulvivirga ligni]|uniref:calcineurin-like phosphoesterase C-terminal domain-containing protein n=1 Tax=Fulvivirga ligni TaxID=2904246 RepID=UPI001F18ACDC|nr:calcineurin-like phosphoesterase C-terminal domain-containing protein [Fulvivirga ligni]UII19095.1 calcineurin-like phosphoesterase C-terminal domain-containing protein [Fulvivirga ligni]
MKNIAILLSLLSLSSLAAAKNIKGKVYVDQNQNMQWDKGENLLPNILISNGRDIVPTNEKGEYKIAYIEGNQVFIIKPSQYISPMIDNRPQNYAPAAALEAGSYDFALIDHPESPNMTVALLGDPQVKYIDDVHSMSKTVTDELAGQELAYVVPLGDITFDSHDLFQPLAESLGLIGAPVFYVMGNHDQNYDAAQFNDRDKNFENYFGPSYYAFEFGKDLGIIVNNIYPLEGTGYKGMLDEDQYTFIKNLLAITGKDYRYVRMFMHIPLEEMEDMKRVIDLFKGRKNVLVVTGHTHTQYHKDFKRAGEPDIHELVAGATCGSWWSGPRDLQGVPSAIMNDGSPRGYWFLNTANETFRYKASEKPADYQMSILTPEINIWDTTFNEFDPQHIYVNVFAGSEATNVQITFDGENWTEMSKYEGMDPTVKQVYYLQQQGRFDSNKISKMWEPKVNSDHLWRIAIPEDLKPGTYLIRVKAEEKEFGLDAVGMGVLVIGY